MKLINFWSVFIFLSSFSHPAFTPRSGIPCNSSEIKLNIISYFHLEPEKGVSQPASQLSGVLPIRKEPLNISKVLGHGW